MRDIDSVIAACRRWEERRDELDYEIDGVVVKINDYEPQSRSASWGASHGGRSPSSSRRPPRSPGSRRSA